MHRLLALTASLITASLFIETTETLEFIIQPLDGAGALNQNPSVTFRCRVKSSDLISKPYWVLALQTARCGDEVCLFSTQDDSDRPKLDQLNIEYKSDDKSTNLTIPALVKNNFTEIRCAAFSHGITEFSEAVNPNTVEEEMSGSGLQVKNITATHLDAREAKRSHVSPSTNIVKIEVVGIVSGCITVALLVAVITVVVAVAVGMRRRKHQMKGATTAVYVAIESTPPVKVMQNNSCWHHHKGHSVKPQQEKLTKGSDQVDTIPTVVTSDQKST